MDYFPPLICLLLVCLAGYYASKARESMEIAMGMTRKLREKVEDLDIENIRNVGNIKRILSTVGGLTRGANKIQDVKLPGELPDPQKDPEGWRAAVRRQATQPKPKKEELN